MRFLSRLYMRAVCVVSGSFKILINCLKQLIKMLMIYRKRYMIKTWKEVREWQKNQKKHKLEKVALIVSIISSLTSTICLIYETFFK